MTSLYAQKQALLQQTTTPGGFSREGLFNDNYSTITGKAVYYPKCRVVIQTLFNDLSGVVEKTTFSVVPKTLRIEKNHHRNPDTFSMTLSYEDFPLDPRTVDAILVQIYMGNTTSVTEISTEEIQFVRFVGYVDEPDVKLTEKSEEIKLSGRDYTALLLDYRWEVSVRMDQSLERVLRNILNAVPSAKGFVLQFSKEAIRNLIPADVFGRTLYSPQQGDDVWTVIVDICGRLGLIPVVILDAVYVFDSETFTNNQLTFHYGINVSSIQMKKKFQDASRRQIKVDCWDPQARELRTALYPNPAPAAKQVITVDGRTESQEAPQFPYYLTGSYTQSKLLQIAENIYKESAREEIEGIFSTHEMVDLYDNPGVPDLANGDQILFRIKKTAAFSDMSQDAVFRELSKVMPPEQALAIGRASENAEGLSSAFYVKKVVHEWNRDTGYKMECTFVNYVGGITEAAFIENSEPRDLTVPTAPAVDISGQVQSRISQILSERA